MKMKRKIKILLVMLCTISIVIILASVGIAKGMLRVSSIYPRLIDPVQGVNDTASRLIINQVYDPLLFPDTQGNPLPHLAESWETSSDGLVWTFHIRPGVKFHSGNELTAEDVKFSMDRLLTIGEGNAYLFLAHVSETEAIDKYTVAFHMQKTFGPFLSTLPLFPIVDKELVIANIENTGLYGDMGDYGKEFLLKNDAGSGPYKIKEYSAGEFFLLEKNPNYWLDMDPDAPDEVKIIATTEPVAVRTMMARRELEITDKWQSSESLEALSKIEGVKVASFNMSDVYFLEMHTRKPPTDDIHFRKAMAYAFDYEAAVKLFPGASLAKGPTSTKLPGTDPSIFYYQRDLDKARAELQKSKYYGQLDKYPVELHCASEIKDEEKVGMLFMSNMDEIGITVNVKNLPWLSMFEESGNIETSPHIFTIINPAPYPEAGSQLVRYHSNQAASAIQNEWLLDPLFDKMVEESEGIVNKADRFLKYGEIEKYIIDLCPTIFVDEPPQRRAYQADYVDWPNARGEAIPVAGYEIIARLIKVYPEKIK